MSSHAGSIHTEKEKENGDSHTNQNQVSVGDVLQGTATEELTIFERKAALINA